MGASAREVRSESMDLLQSLEIFIPTEAEVKTIPLLSLPNSVLRRMGLPLSDSEDSRKLAGSPEGIWICPAVVRKKGQKSASRVENNMIESMSSLMRRECRATLDPFPISFVSSNVAAFKLLQATLPGNKVPASTTPNSSIPQGSVPQSYEDAVVIYHGRVYLSIRRPKQSRRETCQPQPASQTATPSTSCVSSKSQRKSPQASLEPAEEELRRKRQRVTSPQISPKPRKDPLPKKGQEMLSDNNPAQKLTARDVKQRENRKDAAASKTTRSVLRRHRREDAGGVASVEEAAGPQPVPQQQHHAEEEEKVQAAANHMPDLDTEEAESSSQNMDGDSNSAGCDEPHSTVGIVGQSSTQSWTRTEPWGAACASTSIQQVDFNELAQEEKIARIKAQLRLSEAALSSLHSSS